MHEQFKEILNSLIFEKRITSRELSEATNIPLPSINRLRSDSNVNPTVSTLIPICNYFNITLDKLLGFSPFQSKTVLVPLLKWENALLFIDKNEVIAQTYIPTDLSTEQHLYALQIESPNLIYFEKESIIFISANKKPKNSDFIIVHSMKNNYIGIKQIVIDLDNTYLKSLSENLGLIKLTEEYKILGVIIQKKYDFK